VCENIGACSHGGDTNWIDGCESDAKLQQERAQLAGCNQAFDKYYQCADENYVCKGASARFPNCDATKEETEKCLADASVPSACAALTARRASCLEIEDSGGDVQFISEPAGTSVCDLQHECEARCYLDQVERVCAPTIDELAKFSDCAATCS
jgi:hypothetical protein